MSDKDADKNKKVVPIKKNVVSPPVVKIKVSDAVGMYNELTELSRLPFVGVAPRQMKLELSHIIKSNISYRINKNLILLKPIYSSYIEKRNEFIDKYGILDKNDKSKYIPQADSIKLIKDEKAREEAIALKKKFDDYMEPLNAEEEDLPSNMRKLEIRDNGQPSDIPDGVPSVMFRTLQEFGIVDEES